MDIGDNDRLSQTAGKLIYRLCRDMKTYWLVPEEETNTRQQMIKEGIKVPTRQPHRPQYAPYAIPLANYKVLDPPYRQRSPIRVPEPRRKAPPAPLRKHEPDGQSLSYRVPEPPRLPVKKPEDQAPPVPRRKNAPEARPSPIQVPEPPRLPELQRPDGRPEDQPPPRRRTKSRKPKRRYPSSPMRVPLKKSEIPTRVRRGAPVEPDEPENIVFEVGNRLLVIPKKEVQEHKPTYLKED